MTNLTSMYAYDNQITSLPFEIENLTQLTHLSIRNNQITSVPPEIGKLTKLTHLDMANNQIASLPPEIGKLTKLTSLYVENNQITSLSPEIGNLASLIVLRIDNNQITFLPPEIGNFIQLRHFNMGKNQITSLPIEINNLTNLTSLYVENNQISSLPFGIENLANLTIFSALNNQLINIPKGVDFLFELNSSSTCYVNGMHHDVKGMSSQKSILEMKTFSLEETLIGNELVPQLLHQVIAYEPLEPIRLEKATYTIKQNNQVMTEVSLMDIIGKQVVTKEIFPQTGEYDVIIKTLPTYDIISLGISRSTNFDNHVYIYKVIIGEPETITTAITEPFAITGTSQKGTYEISANGIISGEFEEGETVLDAEQLAELNFRGVIKHTQAGDSAALTQNKLIGASVFVTNQEISNIVFYGKGKTASGKNENFVLDASEDTPVNTVFLSNGNSAKATYSVYLNGELPTDLKEGKNTLNVAKIQALNLRGVAFHNEAKDYAFITQNAITSMQITVKNGEVIDVVISGSTKTASGKKETYKTSGR